MVLRVTGMPHNIGAWIDDQPHQLVLYVDEEYITESGAKLLQAAFALLAPYWQPSPHLVERPHLSLHTG